MSDSQGYDPYGHDPHGAVGAYVADALDDDERTVLDDSANGRTTPERRDARCSRNERACAAVGGRR